VVDADGLAALTMRRLGEELGVDAAMLYRVFPGKEDMLEALADRVFDEAPDRAPAEVGSPDPPDWYESLRRAAHGIRQSLLAHPALIGVAVRRPPRQPATFRGMDAGVGLLLAAGLPPHEAARSYQALLFYTLGFAVLEAPFATAPDGGRADQAATQQAIEALAPEQYPNLAATSRHLYDADLSAQFDHGLRLLLDGHAGTAWHGGTIRTRPNG
jgi:TetR/AcrR family tetracycline transcriptional repressor